MSRCSRDLMTRTSGYHFQSGWTDVATKMIANFIEKASRLYEQERDAALAATALEMYIKR